MTRSSTNRAIFARDQAPGAPSNARVFSISRMIAAMAEESLNGYEAEVLQEVAHATGRPYDRQRVDLPLGLLRDPTLTPATIKRALTTGTASSVVGTSSIDEADILRPWSVTARAGISIISGLTDDVAIPKGLTDPTTYWLGDESDQAEESQPTVGQIAMAPKMAGGYVRMTRQLRLQSVIVDAVVQRALLGSVGKLVDMAVLAGTGADGQPLGIANTPGVNAADGMNITRAALLDVEKTSANADGDNDESFAFIADTAARKVLKSRESASGSGFLWNDNRLVDRPSHCSTVTPASTIISGPWSDVLLGTWGVVRVEINPFDGFRSGIVAMRLLMGCDVGVLHPAAFVKTTGVS